MSDILYVQTDKNRKIQSEKVYLQEIASLSCTNPAVLSRCETLLITVLPKGRYGRYPMSAAELIRQIQKNVKNTEITHIGEADFVLTYENPGNKNSIYSWVKTMFVCILTFFGTMFSIMTFNNDVDVPGLFDRISMQLTGHGTSGFSALEIGYSLGIGVGVVFFFNHFGKWKLSHDPTPMEVEMRTYEDDVDATILEQERRRKKK